MKKRLKKIKKNIKIVNAKDENKSFIVKNSSLITIIISLVSILINFCIYYNGKIESTSFNITYETIKIGDFNLNSEYYKKLISYPTIENDVEKILNDFSISLDNYYAIYLVVTQYGDVPNTELIINFTKYGNYDKDKLIKKLSNVGKKDVEKISYSLSKNESIKVPIGICKVIKNEKSISDCVYIKYEPIDMVYKNKYLFSKKTKEIRKLQSFNLYIDGENFGMGGEVSEKKLKWYLRK